MSHSNGIVGVPVELDDVNYVMSTSYNAVENIVRANEINMWAKYKPVRFNSNNTLVALNAARTAWNPNCASNLQWWKASDGNYGLDPSGAKVDFVAMVSDYDSIYDALTSLWSKIDGDLCSWTYQKPRATALTPDPGSHIKRLHDFLQYNHNADKPIRSLKTYDVMASKSASSIYEVSVEYIESEPTDITIRDYIRPDDIMNGTLYRGIAIFRRNGVLYEPIAWCTGVTWEGGGIWDNESFVKDNTNTYATTKLGNGNIYYVLPFYSTVQLTQQAAGQSPYAPSSGSLYAMPYTRKTLSFRATQAERTAILSNKSIASNYSYSATLSIRIVGSTITTSWEAAVVNENYNGSPTTSPSGSYYGYQQGNDETFNGSASGVTTQVCTFSIPANTLTQNHSWRVHLVFAGLDYDITLRSPATPV